MDNKGNCYKKNFIKKVIAKIEFMEPVSIFTPETMTEVIGKIKKDFQFLNKLQLFNKK